MHTESATNKNTEFKNIAVLEVQKIAVCFKVMMFRVRLARVSSTRVFNSHLLICNNVKSSYFQLYFEGIDYI